MQRFRRVKAILIAIIIVVVWASLTMAADVTFTWDAHTAPDLESYKLYQSNVSDGHVLEKDGGMSIATIPAGTEIYIGNISEGGWYWVLTAVDMNGNESDPSNECSKYIDETAPSPPGGFQCFIGSLSN